MSSCWYTPRWIIRDLGPFDLDPCAADLMPIVTADVCYTKEEDGLSLPWFGKVWLNPPYGRGEENWLERMARHDNGIALLFSKTETDMFFNHVWGAARAVFFFRRRIKFSSEYGKAGHNAPKGSVAIAYGPQSATRLERADLPGAFITLPRPSILIVDGKPTVWAEVVGRVLGAAPRRLTDIYADLEQDPRVVRAQKLGHRWRSQVRRTLQFHFVPVDRGVWKARTA